MDDNSPGCALAFALFALMIVLAIVWYGQSKMCMAVQAVSNYETQSTFLTCGIKIDGKWVSIDDYIAFKEKQSLIYPSEAK